MGPIAQLVLVMLLAIAAVVIIIVDEIDQSRRRDLLGWQHSRLPPRRSRSWRFHGYMWAAVALLLASVIAFVLGAIAGLQQPTL